MNTRPTTLALCAALLFALVGGAISRPRASSRAVSGRQQGLQSPVLLIYADPTAKGHRYTPPPQAFLRHAPRTATITVNFVGAWDPQAQAAFQFAAGIWETQITSSVPIVVRAEWAALPGGVLGAASAADHFRDFSNAPQSSTWYPIALANKLSGADLNSAVQEINATFNSTFPDWYLGTDGNTPLNKWDLVSVVLHELGHGLGFAGSMNVDDGNTSNGTECNDISGTGCWGYGSGFPFIYDRFTQNGSGTALLSLPNNSTSLGAQLTGNNIFFDGPNANAANANAPVELYAPAQWQPGSSYSHLGESFNNTSNALMTYALPPGQAIHDPGPVVRGIFGDMGWTIQNATPTPSPTFTSVPSQTVTPTMTSTPSGYDAYMPLTMRDFSLLTPTPAPLPSDWLGYFNALRAIGGLPSVAENASWSNGCALHARYMVKNDVFGVPEDPANPWYTAEGDAAAQNANLMLSASATLTDTDVLDLWLSAPFHGLGMLAPGMQSTGFGSYREVIGQFQTGACLDITRGLGSASLTYPLAWPGDGEASPLAAATIQDTPDPLSACNGYTLPTGAPVYLLLGPGWTITPTVTTSSFVQNGTALPHCVLSAATYTNPDPALQQLGRMLLYAHDAVVLIPKDPLIPGTQYSVALTVDGQQYAWRFTVRAAALQRRIPSKIRIR